METQDKTQMDALDRYVDERIKQAITADRAAQAEVKAMYQAQSQPKKEAKGVLDRYLDTLDEQQAQEAADEKRLREYYGFNDGE